MIIKNPQSQSVFIVLEKLSRLFLPSSLPSVLLLIVFVSFQEGVALDHMTERRHSQEMVTFPTVTVSSDSESDESESSYEIDTNF